MNSGREEACALVAAMERQLILWGGELHSGVCQSLAGTGMFLATVRRAAERGAPIPLERLRDLERSIETAIDQLRKLSRDFNPIPLEGTGLMLALFDFAEQLSARVKCKIVCEKPVLVHDRGAALNLYRAVQEICQVSGDGFPAEFTISLSGDQNTISLQIVKKGDQSNASAALASLRMRAIGGQCIVSRSTESESITLHVPVGQMAGQ